MDTLKDILIEADEIDRYFDEEVPVNLWRARKRKSVVPLFHLVEEEITRSTGQVRRPDITVEQVDGVKWVRVRERPRGISTFDKPDVFRRGDWEYYKIPQGTPIPDGLAIVRDRFNPTMNAVHDTIAPAFDMPLKRFKDLLNALAASLRSEAV